MSDVMTWKYEPEGDHCAAFIGEYTADGRMIRFVCQFIEPPTYEDAATLVAGKNELSDLRAALERAQMSLAGCGVISGCNTEESFAKATSGIHPDYMTASLQSVIDAVRREIDLRAALSERDRMLGDVANTLRHCIVRLNEEGWSCPDEIAVLSAYDASKREGE